MIIRNAVSCSRNSFKTLKVSRSLFTLPDLSSLSPFGGPQPSDEPQTYHERKILPYRLSELYGIVSDVSSYPHFIPFCTDARVLSRFPSHNEQTGRSNTVMEAELTVGFLTFSESYTSKVICRPHESVEAVASSSTPLFKSLTTIWRFQPASPRSPHLSRNPQLATPLPQSRFSSSTTQPAKDSNSPKDPDSGPTLVTLDLSFAFANPVHAAVSAAFFGQVSKMMVKAFEERCIDVYGPGRK